jgi:hypothetical protein
LNLLDAHVFPNGWNAALSKGQHHEVDQGLLVEQVETALFTDDLLHLLEDMV